MGRMTRSDDRDDANVAPFLPRDDEDSGLDEGLGHLFDLDSDEDAFFAQWDEADAEAVELLKDALPEIRKLSAPTAELADAAEGIRAGLAGGERPYSFVSGAAGWGDEPPADDAALWINTTGSLLAGVGDFPMSDEEWATINTLEHGDWLGAVLGLVRAGASAPATPGDLVRYADECPEVEGETDPEDSGIIEEGFGLLLELWKATGAVDKGDRLTELGRWGLPRALAWAWQGDFDA